MRPRLFIATTAVLLLVLVGSAYFMTASRRGNFGASKHTSIACPRSDDFARYIESKSGAQSPASSNTPLPEAGSFETVYSNLLSLAGTMIDEPDDIYSPDVQTKLQRYWWDTLWKKHVSGWEGWVVSTGIDAVRLMHMSYDLGAGMYEVEDNPLLSPYPGAILVSMENPFTSSPVLTSTFSGNKQIAKPYIVLLNVQDGSDRQVCVGEKISFDGDVLIAPGYNEGRLEVALANASLSVVENYMPERDVADDLRGVMIQLRRIPGWLGADYLLTIFGDGTVVFKNRYDGQKIAGVDEATVRKLLDEFDKADFQTMPNYDRYGGSDAPYARTTLIRDGKRKSVLHYFGNDLDATKLTNLEKQIDTIVNTDQFLHMCDTELGKYAPYPCPGRK